MKLWNFGGSSSKDDSKGADTAASSGADNASSAEDGEGQKTSSLSEESSSSPAYLSPKMTSGPAGLGDPDDRTLRKVETEVLVPKLVRERAKKLKCADLKQDFDQCCLDHAMMMVVNCRDQNRRYQECMASWFHNKDFVAECTEIYLQQRAEFRRTGVKQNPRRAKKQ
ncbi:PREDICTED: COX assembly mitochondrial protein homolog, partial [Rhagoletis zephyria]|uniref:COX assembly mitochondrial protein homolog n=1 Tax=Rhagoletis zephyria TaxID=28612 RepID=UPI0008113570